MTKHSSGPSNDALKKLVSQSLQSQTQREAGYREKSLKLYSWVCGRCAREFNWGDLTELTVHHRDHNHDNNLADGSN